MSVEVKAGQTWRDTRGDELTIDRVCLGGVQCGDRAGYIDHVHFGSLAPWNVEALLRNCTLVRDAAPAVPWRAGQRRRVTVPPGVGQPGTYEGVLETAGPAPAGMWLMREAGGVALRIVTEECPSVLLADAPAAPPEDARVRVGQAWRVHGGTYGIQKVCQGPCDEVPGGARHAHVGGARVGLAYLLAQGTLIQDAPAALPPDEDDACRGPCTGVATGQPHVHASIGDGVYSPPQKAALLSYLRDNPAPILTGDEIAAYGYARKTVMEPEPAAPALRGILAEVGKVAGYRTAGDFVGRGARRETPDAAAGCRLDCTCPQHRPPREHWVPAVDEVDLLPDAE